MRTYTRYIHFACSFLLLSVPQTSASQDSLRYERATSISPKQQDVRTPTSAMRPHWISGKNEFWFQDNISKEGPTFLYVDPKQGLRRPAFDHEGVASALRKQGIEASATKLPFSHIDVSDGCAVVRFRAGEKNWEWTEDGGLALFHGDIPELEDDEAIANFAAGSGKRSAVIEKRLPPQPLTEDLGSLSKRQSSGTDNSPVFFRDYNVWYRDTNGQETQMSTTGTEDSPFSNQTWFSPDNKFVVVFQSTPAQSHIVYQVESSPPDQLQPRLHQFEYLKPGDNATIDRPRMFDLTNKREVPTDNTLFENPYWLFAMYEGWNTEGTEFRFIYNQRGHQVVRILGMSTNGDVRALLEEKSDTFIDFRNKFLYWRVHTSNSTGLIWASERDGWNHLYFYDLDNWRFKNQITQGEWVVRDIDYVDETKQQIWLKIFGAVPGQDPYYTHLARVNFDGSDFKILTEGDGDHSWSFSEDRSVFTDTWSRMDMAPKTVTRDAETGKQTAVVQEGTLDNVVWPIPEHFAAPGRDNSTLIYGLIFRPYQMDNNTKYPVVELIYSSPDTFAVPKAYISYDFVHEIANQGFVVVVIDGMGTNWRSKAFHDVCYKNLKDGGFPDRIPWINAAASTRPWMDISRVGVFGNSAGGQNALSALLFHNDFYSVAAADAGDHDSRLGMLEYNEAWMGYPVDQSYEDNSNVVHAGKLKGSLLLTVGELDTFVDPVSTMQVVNALTLADKDYELVIIPGGGHSTLGTHPYTLRRTREFLYRKLKGTEPPRPWT